MLKFSRGTKESQVGDQPVASYRRAFRPLGKQQLRVRDTPTPASCSQPGQNWNFGSRAGALCSLLLLRLLHKIPNSQPELMFHRYRTRFFNLGSISQDLCLQACKWHHWPTTYSFGLSPPEPHECCWELMGATRYSPIRSPPETRLPGEALDL